jgi:hypothetical protein
MDNSEWTVLVDYHGGLLVDYYTVLFSYIVLVNFSFMLF